MTAISDNHIARVAVSFEFLFELMRVGYAIGGDNRILKCVEGLPPDAEYIECLTDATRPRTVYFVFRHPSFEAINQGDIIPLIRVVHKCAYMDSKT